MSPIIRKPVKKVGTLDEDIIEASSTTQQSSSDTVKTGEELTNYIEDIAETVKVGIDQSISMLTPWFFNNMPQIYYQTTPRQEKVRHLSAIITGHVFETKQTVELWDRDRSKVTFIGPGDDREIVLNMTHRLQAINLKMGAVYFSRDKLLFLSTFFCQSVRDLDLKNQRIVDKIASARKMMVEEFPDEGDAIDRYLHSLDNDFVIYATAARLHITYRMYRYMQTHEGAHTFVETFDDNTKRIRLSLGMKNAQPAAVAESIIHLIHRYNYSVVRVFIVNFEKGLKEPISVFHFILGTSDDSDVLVDSIPMRRLNKALRTLGWVDVDAFEDFAREPYNFSINAANLVRAMATWAHLFLGKDNPYIYSQYKIQSTFFKYAQLTASLVELFRIKFDPLKAKDRQENRFATFSDSVYHQVDELIEEVDRNIFRESLNFINHILRTNYFLATKTGLAFRMSPDVLNPKYYANKPFGIFFIIGRDFRCFQVRWKDIARGGLRVVMPRSAADYDYALSGLFDEVYGLSYAQQLKNKDIPEGGSKAVLVLKPGGHRDQAVRRAVNALLDLLVAEDESHEGPADDLMSYYNKEEIIYLGPDENITNELIEWIPAQAARRGYKYASAFMSSKPGEGINHKEYGVTSEGLNVFVTNMLHFLGVDPKRDTFTIKMTGGPDGDVAGNELRILHREFGENARVVAISDGFGAAYDPQGLNWAELLRLVAAGLSIAEFNAKMLSQNSGAFVITADTSENTRLRNELFFKVYADIFIPAGGRPYSVNDKNWEKFLGADGRPTLKAVVEGANIFFTAEARNRLQEQGVLIIKDSSANKTGVICSSFEIIASLTLSTKEFMEIKEEYVKQVLDILRQKADNEAKLLFRAYQESGARKTLVELSMEISREINDLTDLMLDELTKRQEEILSDPTCNDIIIKHCPPVLVRLYRDRIESMLPPAHKIAIIAAYIASYIIYREGLGWMARLPEAERYTAAKTYMEKDLEATALVSAIESSGLEQKTQIAEILRRSAARDLTMIDIERRDN